MTWIVIKLIGLGLLIILSAFFSSSEVAYTGLTLGQLKRVNRVYPKALELWEKTPDRVLATLLLSNNAVNVGVGVLAASVALEMVYLYGWRHMVVTFFLSILSSLLVLVWGEIIPKVWAKKYNLSWALMVTPFMRLWSKGVAPLSQAALSVIWVFSGRQPNIKTQTPFLQEDELNRILTHSVIPKGSRAILRNVMEFSDLKVSDVMTHRSEIFAVSKEQPMEKIIMSIIQSGFSRVPVYEGSVSNIKGILYSKDLLVAWRSGMLLVMEDLIRPPKFVDVNTPLPELMRTFRAGHQHMALAIDGKNTSRVYGLVTLQDAIEAITGPIREEA